MRTSIALSFLAGFMAVALPAATVEFAITPLGQVIPPGGGAPEDLVQYNYFLIGFDFLANQALDIEFDPAVFSQLSNGIAGQGFSLLVFQPNNPPGASGLYSALASIDHPQNSQTFSVNALLTGFGTAGAQPYTVDAFDASGNFLGPLSSGTTVPVPTNAPEPSTTYLAALALGIGYVGYLFRTGKITRFSAWF